MGTYYYVKDPETKGAMMPIYEDDYLAAIFKIARDKGVIITDKMITEEINKRWTKSSKNKSSNRKSKTASSK